MKLQTVRLQSLSGFFRAIGVLTGKAGAFINKVAGVNRRHNEALRQLKDWAATVDGFFITYRVRQGGLSFLVENGQKATFDLVNMHHRGSELTGTVRRIRDAQVLSLFTEVVSDVEELRRALRSPSLRRVKLAEIVENLSRSFTRLKERLEKIAYL